MEDLQFQGCQSSSEVLCSSEVKKLILKKRKNGVTKLAMHNDENRTMYMKMP